MRWILPGAPGSAVQEWFARFPVRTETREDTYLVFPPLDGLSLKFRAGRTLEAKCYLGSPGLLCLPARGLGRLESWRKWSFPDGLLRPVDQLTSVWVTVRKSRRSVRFPLPAGQDPVPEPSPDVAGCAAELTEADAGGQPMWTVGLEATGPAERLPGAIRGRRPAAVRVTAAFPGTVQPGKLLVVHPLAIPAAQSGRGETPANEPSLTDTGGVTPRPGVDEAIAGAASPAASMP